MPTYDPGPHGSSDVDEPTVDLTAQSYHLPLTSLARETSAAPERAHAPELELVLPSREELVATVVGPSLAEPEPAGPAVVHIDSAHAPVEPAVIQVLETALEQSAPGSTAAGLDAVDISAWFGTNKVLERVSLSMPPRTVTALIGPSGCG